MYTSDLKYYIHLNNEVILIEINEKFCKNFV